MGFVALIDKFLHMKAVLFLRIPMEYLLLGGHYFINEPGVLNEIANRLHKIMKKTNFSSTKPYVLFCLLICQP